MAQFLTVKFKIHNPSRHKRDVLEHALRGVNIARRVLYKKAKWENKGGYPAFHRSFAK